VRRRRAADTTVTPVPPRRHRARKIAMDTHEAAGRLLALLCRVMERNVVDEDRPRNIATQFELFAAKLMETWISAGNVQVSAGDLRMAADFLRQVGWQVQEAEGLMVRLKGADGNTQEMTREAAMMFAVRCLADQGAQP
jgi:hypothetical protein